MEGGFMDTQKFESILQVGETIAVEFKRCGNGIENDVYESVCSFLNRFGGDIFRIIVPLDDEYSSDSLNEKVNGSNWLDKSDQSDQSDQSCPTVDNFEESLIKLLLEKPDIKTKEITASLGLSSSQVKYYIKKLKDNNKVIRHGTSRNGYWEIL